MTRALLGALVLALAGTACAHADPAVTAPAANPAAASSATSAHPAGMCPMSVPETKVVAADTSTGESLTFTTTSDQVSVLREKVHAMSDMHNRHQASGDAARGGAGSMGGMMAGGAMGPGMAGMPMPPPSRTAVEDLYDGARIIMTPVDPADLQRLQATVRTRAENLQQNGCGMMHHS
jgi:hypothetical protein